VLGVGDQALTAATLMHHDATAHHLDLWGEVLGADEGFIVVIGALTNDATLDLRLGSKVIGGDVAVDGVHVRVFLWVCVVEPFG